MLFRNIRSKEAPNGEFVLSPIMYDLIFNKPVKQTLLNTGDTQYWHKLFGITIGCLDGSVRQTRELNKGIDIAEPAKVSLIKIIGGDDKDNVFSIFSWDASTGTRTYGVTELQIKKAIDMCGWEFNNTGCRTVFDNYSNLQVFVNLLRKVIKQEKVNLKDNRILDHIKHNMKMIILSPKFLPEELVNEFEVEWDKKKSDILVDVDYSSFVKEKLTEFSNTKQTTQIYSEAISNIGMEFFKK
ncbi:MAG: hypothetical protein EZS28_016424 [Streblomastix strix]|uniref:Uncharacterized protein n=1 Tax=Streblomastix strix TaxID=222440 RepID=A0A5J4VZQ2_9EUKA|nr:MAG: hypothetical protein EZS28_016424 [Streblomastix strix]